MAEVPFIDLKREVESCSDELVRACESVIRSGSYILGKNVGQFERAVEDRLGVKHAVSVGNGSDALTFIFKALGLGHGDEVICPANSFIASAWSIVASGATPVFCDVNDDLLISVEDVLTKVTEKTRAILVVHLTGRMVDIDLFRERIGRKDIYIVEDAAQAFGAHDDQGRFAGSVGVASGFSLHPLKNLALCGDGGIITTQDDLLAERVRLLRNHGLADRDRAVLWGYNSRLDEMQAAIANVKLKYFDKWTDRYIEIAHQYDQGITKLAGKPSVRRRWKDVYHNYVVTVDLAHRDKIMDLMLQNGVQTKVHYPIPLHLQQCSIDLVGRKQILNAERLANSMISLPIYPYLTDEEIQQVISSFNEAFLRVAHD